MKNCLYVSVLFLGFSVFAQIDEESKSLFAKIQKHMLSKEIDSMAITSIELIQSLKRANDTLHLANLYQQLGSAYFYANNFDSSQKYHLLAVEIFQQQGNYEQAAHTIKQLGINYQSELQFEKALKANLEAYELFLSLQDSVEMSLISTHLSSLNIAQGNYDLSLEYALKAYKIALEIDDKPMIGLSLIQIGMHYLTINAYDSALKYGNESFDLFNENKIGFGKMDAHQLIVSSLVGLNQINDAELKAKEYLQMASNSGSVGSQSNARFLLGKIFVLSGKYDLGIRELNKSIDYARRMNNIRMVMESFFYLSIAHEKSEAPDKALSYLRKYLNFRDSTYSREKSKEIEKLQAQYSLKSKQREINQLQTVSELKDLRIQQARDRLILISLIAIAISIIIFLIYNRKLFKQKLNFIQEKERILKNRFRAVINAEEKERKRIAQELHDGLGQILSTARLTISSMDNEEQNSPIQQSLKLIDTAVDETRNISHNLMPNALIALGLRAALLDLVRSVNLSGGIKASIEIDRLPELDESTSVAIYRVIQETINNSLKYAEASTLSVKIQHDHTITIEITDNGKGFDVSDIGNSNGIGWQNIYSRAEMMHGNVSVYSKLGQGTTVKINFPFDESSKASTG